MYKRNILTADDNAANVQHNQSAVLMHSELYQPSPVDEFYTESVIPVDGSECVFHVDPLIMLFNQQRIDNLGSLTAKQFLDSLQQKESSLSELRKKCSDDDLMAMMKSRYLQTPSEIMSYADILNLMLMPLILRFRRLYLKMLLLKAADPLQQQMHKQTVSS